MEEGGWHFIFLIRHRTFSISTNHTLYTVPVWYCRPKPFFIRKGLCQTVDCCRLFMGCNDTETKPPWSNLTIYAAAWFSLIIQVTFQPDLKITHMHSSEGEIVELKYQFYPTANVEQWLLLLEDTMRHSSTFVWLCLYFFSWCDAEPTLVTAVSLNGNQSTQEIL